MVQRGGLVKPDSPRKEKVFLPHYGNNTLISVLHVPASSLAVSCWFALIRCKYIHVRLLEKKLSFTSVSFSFLIYILFYQGRVN